MSKSEDLRRQAQIARVLALGAQSVLGEEAMLAVAEGLEEEAARCDAQPRRAAAA